MFSTIEEAVADFAAGKMLVLVDDETRENEGDIIFAAEAADEAKINFILSHARGVICTPLSRELAEKFELPLMVAKNSSNHETPFTITIDAAEAATGVSTAERCMTIRRLIEPGASAASFVRPGHINPLIAKDGGVLERTGHTEGTVDLCALAGLQRVGVLCEILNDDGTMARRDDLAKFCARWGLKMISIEQLVQYRLERESLVREVAREAASVAGHGCVRVRLQDFRGCEHSVWDFGAADAAAGAGAATGERLVKFYRACKDVQALSENLAAIDRLAREGGLLVELAGEKSDAKSYGIGAGALKALGCTSVRLLSASCERESFAAVAGFGISISCEVKI